MARQEEIQAVIVLGSDSDWPVMEKCADMLRRFKIGHQVRVISAHRTPEALHKFAAAARDDGVKVIIAAAGMSAALAGSLAALTTLPVIGVPMNAGFMDGLDALLSTVQMPPGVPVATMAVGPAGAKNAAILAVQILALEDALLAEELKAFKSEMAKEVAVRDQAIGSKAAEKGPQ